MAKSEEIAQYVRLLEEGKDEQALTFKKTILPVSFFQYRSLSDDLLDCLNKSSVYVKKLQVQNDPYECPLTFSDREFALAIFTSPNFKKEFINHYNTTINDDEVLEIINSAKPELKFREICKRKNVKREYDDIHSTRELISNYFSQKHSEIVLSCFSERKDSILMWSHYAHKHQGVCVEYDFREDNYVLNFVEPIRYSNNFFSISNSLANRPITNQIRIAAITKAIDWQYEEEWRIVFPNKNEGHFKVPKPVRIYVGSRFEENRDELKISLTTECETLGIPISRMKLSPTEFKIEEL